MVKLCSVLGCKNGGNHRYPRDRELAKLWELATGRENFQHKRHHTVCFAHFTPEDYNSEGYYSGIANTRKILKKGAVPTLSLNLKKEERKTKTHTKQNLYSENSEMKLRKDKKKYCCVPQCTNYEQDGLSFHNFPTDDDQRKCWETALQITKTSSQHNILVCSQHFNLSDYSSENTRFRRRLKKNVIPSKKLPAKRRNKLTLKQESVTTEVSTMDVKDEEIVEKNEDEKLECRACLQKFGAEMELVSLFQAWTPAWDGMDISIAEDLAKIANIQLLDTDRYPKVICQDCVQKLREACIFTSLVRNNDWLLRQRYAPPANDTDYEKVWPKPIQLDMNLSNGIYNNTMEIEIKKEILSDDEYGNTNGLDDSYKGDYLNLDIKIEPEELIEQKPQIILNGTIPLEEFGSEKLTLTNGNADMIEEHLEVQVKEEPPSEDEEPDPGHTDLPLECMLCTKVFNSVSGLKVHVIAQHSYKSVKRKTGDNPSPEKKQNVHTCTTCRRSFVTSTDLIVHETCHNQYACYGCNDKFESFDLLAKHRKRCKSISNTAVKPKTLEDVQRPKMHAEDDTNQTLQCSQCSEQFTDVYYLNIHQEVHHTSTKAGLVDPNPVAMETSLEDIFGDK